ncbi:MAG: VanZ family protein [Elusimicrobia bacterium]|nr:VanZ family protein [Elusimicrobiota bacterium]
MITNFSKQANRFLLIAALWSVFLVFLSLQPATEVEIFLPFDFMASLAHAAVYFVLAVLLCLALRFWKYSLISLALSAFIYSVSWGIINELVQFYEPTRSPSLADVFSDSSGAAVGLVVFIWWRKRKLPFCNRVIVFEKRGSHE